MTSLCVQIGFKDQDVFTELCDSNYCFLMLVNQPMRTVAAVPSFEEILGEYDAKGLIEDISGNPVVHRFKQVKPKNSCLSKGRAFP